MNAVQDDNKEIPANSAAQEPVVTPYSTDISADANPLAAVKGQADSMGKIMGKLGEYKACKDKEQRKALESEIVDLYVAFAVPALALALSTLLAFPGAFLLFYASLAVTGRGLPDVEAFFAALPAAIATPASELLAKVDPAIGNAAVAAILLELASPALLLLSAAIKGRIETALSARLPEWGFDADGIRARLERLAGEGEDLF